LDLVRDRDVGVQVGVPGPGVAVDEHRRDQAAGVDLPGSLMALPGVQYSVLDERQGVGHRRFVGGPDLSGQDRVGDRP